MAQTSFGKILKILDLFSTSRSMINVDIISKELELSTPTSYRYLKELVAAELLQRLSGTSGDYVLGPKVAILDYISRTTDPLVQISIPFMQEIAERTEFSCLLSHLSHDSCIDLYDEIFKSNLLLSYGRGCPRPVFIGSSSKIILAHLPKQKLLNYYHRYHADFSDVGFAHNEDDFLFEMRKIKKQGYVFSKGELHPDIAGLSIPIQFSEKETPLSISLIASKNRFDFVDLEKLIAILRESAAAIEQKYKANQNIIII